MNDKRIRVLLALLGAVLLLAAFVPSGSFILQYAPMQAVFPSTVYTITQEATTNAVDLGKYGSLQVQTSMETAVTATTYITPQFSNEIAPCSIVTTWVDAKEQLVFAQSDITPTVGSVSLAWTISGASADNRELLVLGRCFRLKVTSDGNPFTPTGYLRMLSRN
jgi:hypothetical protein